LTEYFIDATPGARTIFSTPDDEHYYAALSLANRKQGLGRYLERGNPQKEESQHHVTEAIGEINGVTWLCLTRKCQRLLWERYHS
jgi:hypothetical protein